MWKEGEEMSIGDILCEAVNKEISNEVCGIQSLEAATALGKDRFNHELSDDHFRKGYKAGLRKARKIVAGVLGDDEE